MFLLCRTCTNENGLSVKFPETNLFSHFRKYHNLASGGKRKDQPTNPDYNIGRIELSPYTMRQSNASRFYTLLLPMVAYWRCFEVALQDRQHGLQFTQSCCDD